jgi:hypothetical protein
VRAATPNMASTTISLRVRPLMVNPSANIRQIRTKWVARLMEIFMERGWREPSRIKVYATIPYEEVKALVERNDEEAMNMLDGIKYKVLDGAHRIRALRILIKDPAAPQFAVNFRVAVEVLPEAKSVVQVCLNAASENARHDNECGKKTFTDDCWAMIKVLGDAVRRLVEFSTAVAELHPDN